jgi:hypothetical protein
MSPKKPNIFIEQPIQIAPNEKPNNGLSEPEKYWRANAVVNPNTGKIEEWRHVKVGEESRTWLKGAANEIGRLAQGHGTFDGTETMHFIQRHNMPKGRQATYLCIVVDFRPQKDETH